jgi:hypothetical protein
MSALVPLAPEMIRETSIINSSGPAGLTKYPCAPAANVQYTDVRQNRSWIVCPACKEAIFKLVRHQGIEGRWRLHYFSEYEASKLTRQTVNFESAE